MPRDVLAVLGARLAGRVEDQLALAPDVHAVQGLGMGMRVESQRRVEALDPGDRAGVGLADRAQAEHVLGAAAQAVAHGLDEAADERSAQLLVVACEGTQLPGATFTTASPT